MVGFEGRSVRTFGTTRALGGALRRSESPVSWRVHHWGGHRRDSRCVPARAHEGEPTPMALSQSVLSELLDAFRAGEGVDLVRDAVRLVMQELIEVEATEQIGADRYERSDTRVTERNGSRPRLLATQAGDVELKIPKLRKGIVLPVDPRAAATDRPGVVRGGDGGLRQRGVDPLGRRPRRRLGRRLGDLQVARCRGSVPGSMRSSAPSAPAGSITSSSPTCISTPPTCTCATAPSQVCSMAVVVATGITADGCP